MIDTKNRKELIEILKKDLEDNNSSGVFNFILTDFSIFEDIILNIKDQLGENNIIFLHLLGDLNEMKVKDKGDLIFNQVYPYIRRNIISGSFFLSITSGSLLSDVIYYEKNSKKYILNRAAKDLFFYQCTDDSILSEKENWDSYCNVSRTLYDKGRVEMI